MSSRRFTLRHLIIFSVLCVWTTAGAAPDTEPWRFDAALSLHRFEQQIKTEVGGERGERLVEESGLGFSGIVTYQIWGPFSAGLYTRYDLGVRKAARFDQIVDGRTVTVGEVGGNYSELWAGPLIRAQWKAVFAELGYGLIGLRHDEARDDLLDESGDSDAALKTSNTVSWLLNLGGAVPINDTLALAVRLEYRVRYYDRRDNPLVDKLVHGTQNFTPFVGVAWHP